MAPRYTESLLPKRLVSFQVNSAGSTTTLAIPSVSTASACGSSSGRWGSSDSSETVSTKAGVRRSGSTKNSVKFAAS